MTFDKIRALDDREKAREKLPIFFGSRDNFLHGFREVCINNTVDEISNNFDSGIINITLHDDLKTITVEDTGRGMPISGISDGVENWQLFFTILFASGKYDLENGENSGTNGVGGTVLNFSSELYSVTSYHNEEEYIIEFENGGQIKTPLTYIGETDKHGTKITFKLDKECYTETKYNPNDLKLITNMISGVSPKTTINFTYNAEQTSYHYDTLEDYYIENIQESDYFQCDQKVYDDNNEITKVEAIFSTSIEPTQQSFLNRNYLAEGGIINKSIISGIKSYIHKYIKDNALYEKKEKDISNEDVENTISFVINVLSSNVEFQSQTKFSSKKELYGKIVKSYIQEQLEIFKIERKEMFKELVNQILLTKRANETAENKRKDVRKKLEESIKSVITRPEKYIPHSDDNLSPEDVEVVIIEGDSALNSIKSARNPENTSIYPLKGKVINAIKNNIDAVLNNSEVRDIFQILGCGVTYKGKKVKGLPVFNIDNLNVGKILITTDRDVDGCHIESLLLALFYTLAPELIKQKKVYILYTPLYIIKHSGKEYFAYTEEERNNLVKSFDGEKYSETRYKGIGGLSPQVLNKTAMNNSNRIVKCVTWENVQQGIEMMELCMSDKTVAKRKEYIESEGYKYFDFSLISD
ncbi:toprim domain-containing protein [uncultured Clostridium sp.]|uniref:toprim domain-containing protein n=1 Tax=uncultured Clostridium sp. TaxID=59620 RepID=UPI00321711EF